jgi:LEA14-like dessication related protein
MISRQWWNNILLLAATGMLSACAGGGGFIVSSPGVSLNNVELTELDYSSQTFLLGFDVSNPNPFPLPVSSVSYGVELDGLRFATGETQGGFIVPANGDGNFAISVQLDLLRTSPRLLHTVRDGVLRDIPYELKGSLGVDIPAAKPVRFQSNGQVRLLAIKR